MIHEWPEKGIDAMPEMRSEYIKNLPSGVQFIES